MSNQEIYFFGCENGQAGHYLWSVGMNRCWDLIEKLPWGWSIDAKLAPATPEGNTGRAEIEGHAALHHKDGWSVLAWWDRSVDKRYGSNAGLHARGTFTAEEMLALGRKYFPAVMSRFTYEITTEPTA